MAEEKKKTKQRDPGLAIGLAIGLCLGAAMDNIPIGVCIGVAIGASFEHYYTKKNNEDKE